MSLAKYKKKRSFEVTPEPTGGKALSSKLVFVVQKHDASHLHYDFRLEMEGVLKSWAIPKGPSMDPKVKRLAMMVEDHPFDYRDFEGIIPKGNYGGGTVMVWDRGTYQASPAEGDKKAQDKALRHQLYQGKIKFTLSGSKLKGDFALVKSNGRGENAWLLMKIRDEFASDDDILKKDLSVVTKKSLEQIADDPDLVYGEKPSKTKPKKAESADSTPKKKSKSGGASSIMLKKAAVSKFPTSLKPMLATLVNRPFDQKGWLYEIKWDGYRAIGLINGDASELKSRNDKSFNEKFYPIYDTLRKWTLKTIVDGEIVVLNEHGVSNFGALQNWRSEADGVLIYYVFDILWLDGKDLTSLPLVDRREILKGAIPVSDNVRVSDTFDAEGTHFYEAAKKMGLEGIIAKRSDSIYQPGQRTNDWLKIKINQRQEVVIGGYTKNDDSSKLFSSLLVGVHENGKLVYTGKIGTGFTEKTQQDMMKQFKPLIVKNAPFDSVPDINKPSRFRPNPPHATATWLKPMLVCEVSFVEMTSDGVMRHPSFEGMRIDKAPKKVVRETAMPAAEVIDKGNVINKSLKRSSHDSERRTLLNPSDETQVRDVDGHSIKFSNLSKIYWPEDNVTKRDMLNYYYQVAPFILPYLKDRPQSLNRYPNGIHGKSFYQKDVTGKVPMWVKTYLYHSSDSEDDKHFMIPTDEASVLLMASLGCIEMNPWSSRIQFPDNPDWCIIDLDPGSTTFDHIIQAALVTKSILDDLKIPSWPKTSGSSGLHIYIPLGAKYTYEQSKEFARVIATMVHRQIPEFTSIERAVSNRGGKMYLDFLQNRPKATLAAPYSLRPKIGATVSMPLDWSEVKKGLTMKHFTIHNSVARILTNGDIFEPVMGTGIELNKIIASF